MLPQALGIDVRLGAALGGLGDDARVPGLYTSRVRWTIAGELHDILVGAFVLAFGTMSFLFVVKLVDVSRLFLLILIAAQPVATILGRVGFGLSFNWMTVPTVLGRTGTQA